MPVSIRETEKKIQVENLIVHRIVFLISFSDCLLLPYKYTMDWGWGGPGNLLCKSCKAPWVSKRGREWSFPELSCVSCVALIPLKMLKPLGGGRQACHSGSTSRCEAAAQRPWESGFSTCGETCPGPGRLYEGGCSGQGGLRSQGPLHLPDSGPLPGPEPQRGLRGRSWTSPASFQAHSHLLPQPWGLWLCCKDYLPQWCLRRTPRSRQSIIPWSRILNTLWRSYWRCSLHFVL